MRRAAGRRVCPGRRRLQNGLRVNPGSTRDQYMSMYVSMCVTIATYVHIYVSVYLSIYLFIDRFTLGACKR